MGRASSSELAGHLSSRSVAALTPSVLVGQDPSLEPPRPKPAWKRTPSLRIPAECLFHYSGFGGLGPAGRGAPRAMAPVDLAALCTQEHTQFLGASGLGERG